MKSARKSSRSFLDPKMYLDRDMSLIAFNRRVLTQAENKNLPAMERLRFLCISSSVLDEFFEVRVASLQAQLEMESDNVHSALRDLLNSLSVECQKLVAEQYRILNQQVLPLLAENGIYLLGRDQRNEQQTEWVNAYFEEHIRPILTPMVLDPAHPFPQVVNKSLHFIISLSGKDAFGRGSDIAILKAPRVLPRVIRLPDELSPGNTSFSLLTNIIGANIERLFPQRKVTAFSQFRVTRDSDLWVDEDEVTNLREALQNTLHSRHFGKAVRLEVAENCPVELSNFLLKHFELEQKDVYRVNGPVNLVRLTEILDHVKKPELYYTPFTPSAIPGTFNSSYLFNMLKKRDILLHHPFESFQTVVDFINAAAQDPNVVVIKQTVYRAGMTSDLMESLISAAYQGKEVIAVVELKARFDEEQNIDWAERLEEAGAHVVYGVMGLKTHAKLALAIRREDGKLRYYTHLGTGNYNASTARLYTDFGLLTANQELGAEVNEVFIQLTSLAKPEKLEHLWLAPFDLHKEVIGAIQNEARIAKQGRKARIIAKMNSLIDESVIDALYAASQAGVKIDLIIRGACSLKPGVPGLSENIRVRSVIGRFLEHTRIYYFFNDKKHDMYLSSADWMSRNLFRRVEVAFPILDRAVKKRVLEEGLRPYLKDNQNAWELSSDGTYRQKKSRKKEKKFAAQQHLMQMYDSPQNKR